MTRASKKKPKQSRARAAVQTLGNARSQRGASAMVVLAVLGACAWGYAPLRTHVGMTRQAADIRVVFDWPRAPGDPPGSTWLPAPEREALMQDAASELNADPFDAGALQKLAIRLRRTGWFLRVGPITRRGEGVVRIQGQWRAMAATVRVGGVAYGVDGAGALLRYTRPVGAAGVKWIQGAWAGPPADANGRHTYGEPWVGGDVQAGLGLLGFLQAQSRGQHAPAVWDQIAGVDVSEYQRRGRVALLTTGGARLVWGAPAGEPKPGECDDAQKLANLRSLLTDPAWEKAGAPDAELCVPGALVYTPRPTR